MPVRATKKDHVDSDGIMPACPRGSSGIARLGFGTRRVVCSALSTGRTAACVETAKVHVRAVPV